MSTTIKRDSSGDLALENNSLVLISDLTSTTAQRLKSKFKFFLGEWKLEPRGGIPYYEEILKKNPKISSIRRIYREVIEGDEGVSSLDELLLDFDSPGRQLSISFSATLIDGSVLEVRDFILAENL